VGPITNDLLIFICEARVNLVYAIWKPARPRMNIAARPKPADRSPPDRNERTGGMRLAFFDDFRAAEPIWRRLEADAAFASPYQRFEWVSHWFAHVGRTEGDVPLLVAGLDATEQPLFILPFISARRFGCRVVRFCGGLHSNLNLPIWRTGPPPAAALLAEIAERRHVDLFALLGQPQTWQGVPNPFGALTRQPSPDDVYTGSLDAAGPHYVPHLPSGMRKKQRKLMRMEGFVYHMAETPAEVERVLAAFRAQKAVRFARQGIRNVFADAAVAAFIRAACLDGLSNGRPAIELHTLVGGGEMLAIVGGVSNARHFSVMFNSITDTARARLSPGIILMAHIIAGCAQRGIASFDLGAGHAPYKSYFSTGSERRFDCFVPFTPRGRVLAAAYGRSAAMRRSVKMNPALMSALQTMRRWTTFGRSPGS
jgi:CelD/BcsL family acetyltransferase involved in cellulose biosynthesis